MKRLIFFIVFITFNINAATVLVIGDSHMVGPFGSSFDNNLRNAGHQVATYGSCGSVGEWWTTGQKTTCGFFSRDFNNSTTRLNSSATPLIDELLQTHRPDIVTIQFGGNYRNRDEAFVIKDLRSIIKKIKQNGAKCFFITNPDTRAYRDLIPRLSATLKKAVSDSCPIFESYLVTKYPDVGGDGIHYYSQNATPIATEWARIAAETFNKIWP